jgi:two-component system cell cycle response regulator
MLTAEGGRDNVIRIAKIGVRDYLVKPFKEEILLEKVGRVIELKPLTDAPTKAKSIFDPATILVVEDKPAIIQQIADGMKNTPWKVHGVPTQGEAIDFCNRTPPDIVIASLSLPDDAAVTLFRLLRSQAKTKYTPMFGLVVKTEVAALQNAQQIGFTNVITKPIDVADLEAKIAKAMNLDTSQRYFAMESDCLVMRLPENSTQVVVSEVLDHLKGKFADAVDAGYNRAVFDIHKMNSLNMAVIKLLLHAMGQCQDLGIQFALVGSAQIISECKGFEDTRNWTFFDTLDLAKASLGRPAAAATPAPVAATA